MPAMQDAKKSHRKTDVHRQAQLATRYGELPKTKMSSWYSIFDLFRTVVDISITEVFRARIDYRTLQAMEQPSVDGPAPLIPPSAPSEKDTATPAEFVANPKFFDYSGSAPSEFWFDFAADVGDGFDSTYYVAALLSQPEVRPLSHDPILREGEKDVAATGPRNQADSTAEGLALPQGRFLLLGGDEVYPSASRESYERRFVRVYEAAAFAESAPDKVRSTHLYAVPGNHDWYDGLASFMAVFADQRAIGRFRTQQRSSYFAIKLPHGFWIFAVDIGLSGELDRRQVEHFQDLARNHLSDGDRIILCIAEPDWVKARPNIENLRDGLFYFERKLAEALTVDAESSASVDPVHAAQPPAEHSTRRRDVRVILRLAGDLHHYRRHTSYEPYHPTDDEVRLGSFVPQNHRVIENITAGGGGAFLHPTHEVDEDRRDRGHLKDGSIRQFPPGIYKERSGDGNAGDAESHRGLRFDFQKAFPSISESRRIALRNLAFGHYNQKMTLSLWLVYGLLMNLGLYLYAERHFLWIGLVMSLLLTVFVSGTKSYAKSEASGEIGESKQGRTRSIYHSRTRIAKAGQSGALHGLSHVVCFGSVFAGLIVAYEELHHVILGRIWPFHEDSWLRDWIVRPDFESMSRFLLSTAAGGVCAIVSTIIFGLYLYFALNHSKLRLHANGAFASLRIADYKNFLRLRVTAEGITVYPIGIREVPKRWTLEIPPLHRGDGPKRHGTDGVSASPQVSLFYPKLEKNASEELRTSWYERLTKSGPRTEPFLIEPPIVIPKR